MLRLFRSGRGPGVKRVTIPDLSGLTKTQIETLLDSLGISYSSTASNTEDSGLANKHKSQSVAAGTTVLRGSSISFEYYNYTAPPYFPPYFPYFPTFIPAPSFSTTPYLSSKTSSSLTWSWVGENYQSWKLYSGGTGEIFASGDGQATSATRSGLSPSTSYTATIRLYSSTGLSGVSTSDAVSGTTEAAPPPAPPAFTPTPPAFTPTPPAFTPTPPAFTPTPPSFPYFKGGKGPGCIYSETRLLAVNNQYIAAKDISVGDKVMAINPSGLLGETIIGANTDMPISLISVDVISVEKSIKDAISFNDLETFYSLEQPIIVDRNGKFDYVKAGEINTGDTIILIDPANNSISSIVVDDITTKQSVDVYDIRTTPYQWYVVENTLAIS